MVPKGCLTGAPAAVAARESVSVRVRRSAAAPPLAEGVVEVKGKRRRIFGLGRIGFGDRPAILLFLALGL